MRSQVGRHLKKTKKKINMCEAEGEGSTIKSAIVRGDIRAAPEWEMTSTFSAVPAKMNLRKRKSRRKKKMR